MIRTIQSLSFQVTRYENANKYLVMVRQCTSAAVCMGVEDVQDNVYACNKTDLVDITSPGSLLNVSTLAKCTFCCDTDYCNYRNSTSGLFQHGSVICYLLVISMMQAILRI